MMKIPATKLDKRFEDTIYLVEADSFALHTLWTHHSKEYDDGFKDKMGSFKNQKQNWKQDCSGFTYEVGTFGKKPIMVTFFFYHIDDLRVGFYDCHSLVKHFGMVEDWIDKNIPTKENGGILLGKCDAQNFHQCLHEIERRNRMRPLK